MRGMITVRCTVLMASGKFAPFFEILIISLTRIAVLYHKRALYNSKKVGGKKKRTESSLQPKYIHVFQVSILSFFEILKH